MLGAFFFRGDVWFLIVAEIGFESFAFSSIDGFQRLTFLDSPSVYGCFAIRVMLLLDFAAGNGG